MLQVKEAVQVSLQNLEELFSSNEYQGLRLEEVNLDEGKQTWSVTFSYKNPDFEDEVRSRRSSSVSGLLTSSRPNDVAARIYKTVVVKAEDGSLLGIKNEWDLS